MKNSTNITVQNFQKTGPKCKVNYLFKERESKLNHQNWQAVCSPADFRRNTVVSFG